MPEELPVHRVEASFVDSPPTAQVGRASGVSDVEVDGLILRCVVCGSFQPFLEALRGHEVISLTSMPTRPGARSFVKGFNTTALESREGQAEISAQRGAYPAVGA